MGSQENTSAGEDSLVAESAQVQENVAETLFHLGRGFDIDSDPEAANDSCRGALLNDPENDKVLDHLNRIIDTEEGDEKADASPPEAD